MKYHCNWQEFNEKKNSMNISEKNESTLNSFRILSVTVELGINFKSKYLVPT